MNTGCAAASVSGQLWTITAIGAGEYRLVPLFQPGRSPSADGGTLALSPTAHSPAQAWRISAAR